MNEQIFWIRSYWGARKEGSDSVSSRICNLLSCLSKLHPSFFENWSWITDDGELEDVGLASDSLESITNAVNSGFNQNETTGEPLAELGY